MKRTIVTVLTALAAVAATAPVASAAEPPLGRTCTPQNGVRFCPGDMTNRVASFDGVPLDVDVTLPPSGDGPFPTLVMLHGWGGNKGAFEATSAGKDLYDNIHFASKGYAVVNYSARGFGNSCGAAPSRLAPGCVKGWLHLADQRYEVHDSQYLLGLLVDQGVAKPDALAATGVSYGGGQSLQLAYLNDRVRQTDGTFVPWTSPNGTSLRLAAAWPRWPWSDLASALAPNGRFLDFKPSTDDALRPVGVPKTSYTSALYALGNASGFIAPPGVDPDADLTTWFAQTNEGEPETEAQRGIVDELHTDHSAMGLPKPPSGIVPLLIQSGWTDDLFPVTEGLRTYNDVRASGPKAHVALQLGDLGHMRGQNKQATDDVLQAQGSRFLDQFVARTGNDAPKHKSVTALTQTCPESAEPGGPFKSPTWEEIHPGAVRIENAAAQTITSDGGDPQVSLRLDPIGGDGACAQVDDADAAGTANYRLPVTQGFTLLGLPAVRAQIDTTGSGGQIASRLWDVAPDGKQVLVARGVYRLADDQKGTVTFQMYGNGYRFEPGHVAKLELLGRDAPFVRPSNGQFSVSVSKLLLELPTVEKPGSGQVVAPTIGLGGKSSSPGSGKQRRQSKLVVTPRRVRAGKTYRYRVSYFGANCKGCAQFPLAGAKVRFGGKVYKLNSAGQGTMTRRFRKAGLVKLRAGTKRYPTRTVKIRVLKQKRR